MLMLFAIISWICIIGFVFFLIRGIVALVQRKKALKWFGFGIGCLLIIIGVMRLAYHLTPPVYVYEEDPIGKSEQTSNGDVSDVEIEHEEEVNETEIELHKEPEEEPEEKTEVEDNLSQDFKEFNNTYYTQYKNYLDLIGSNFQLVAEDMYSQNLIDDLITWTNEFNELLDVYEDRAKPINTVDQQLYSITNEMISSQRNANDYIIMGLENYDNQALMNAGSYIDKVADLYLEGHSQLE